MVMRSQVDQLSYLHQQNSFKAPVQQIVHCCGHIYHSFNCCFVLNVYQKFYYFLSHKVSVTFLNNKAMNDECDASKTSMKSVYVPTLALIHQSIDLLVLKDDHTQHTRFLRQIQHFLNMDVRGEAKTRRFLSDPPPPLR